MSVKRTSATRHEMLERNPQLKKYWLSRVLVGSIIMGAKMGVKEWKHIRNALITTPLLVLLFAYMMFDGTNMSRIDNIIGSTFIVCFTLGWPMLACTAYGYKNKKDIDATGGIEADFRFMSRYKILWALIGVGISTGAGIFAWFKW